jgi:hypothetical protein
MVLLALERNFRFIFISINFPVIFISDSELLKKLRKKESRIILEIERQQSCSAMLTNFLKSFSLQPIYFIFAKCRLWVNILRDPSVQYCAEVFDLFLTDNRFSLSTLYCTIA